MRRYRILRGDRAGEYWKGEISKEADVNQALADSALHGGLAALGALPSRWQPD